MSEDLNRDPLIDKLSRLTPASAGIDREAILFAAGRASASRAGRWKVAVLVLAVTQMATGGLWLTSDHAMQPVANSAPVSNQSNPADDDSSRLPSVDLAANSSGEMLRQWEKSGALTAPSVGDLGPPQQVFSVATGRQALLSD